MPSRVRLRDVWLVDWDSTVAANLELTRGGYYSHAHADVSDDVDSYLVRWGAATEADPNQIELTSAKGVLRLFNRDNRYDPEAGHQDIEKRLLRKPHLCVLLSVDDTRIAGPFEGFLTTGTETDGLRTNLNRPSGGWPDGTAFGIDGVDYPVDTNFLWRQQSTRFGTTPVIPLAWLQASRAGVKVENVTTGRVTYMPFRQSTVARTLEAPFGWQTSTRTGVFRYISPRNTASNRAAAQWDTQPGKAGDYVRVTFVRRCHVAWEGVAINGLGTQLTRQRFVDFELVSRGYRWFQEEKRAFEINASRSPLAGTHGRLLQTVDPRKEDGSLVTKIGQPPAVSGYDQDKTLTDSIYDANLSRLIEDTRGQTDGLGIGFQRFPDTVSVEGREVNATGTTNVGFLNACARYACGWAVENRLGRVGILAWAAALEAPSEFDFDSSFKIRQSDAFMEYRHGYIRNYAEPKAKFIETQTAEEAFNWIVDLSVLRAGNTTYEWNVDRTKYPYGIVWDTRPVRQTLLRNSGEGHVTLSTVYDLQDNKVVIGLEPSAFSGSPGFIDAGYTVSVWVQPRKLVTRVPTQLLPNGRVDPSSDGAIKESVESIPDFGVRRLIVPPWYPLDGSAWTHLTDFVNRLATPLRYFRLTFPRTHTDAGKLAEIDALDAGSIFDIDFIDPVNPLSHAPVRAKVLIVGCRLEHQKLAGRTPFKTVYGITLEVGNVTAARWSHGDTWSGSEEDYWG